MSVSVFPAATGGGGGGSVGTLLLQGVATSTSPKLVGPFAPGDYRLQFLGLVGTATIYSYVGTDLTLLTTQTSSKDAQENIFTLTTTVDGFAIKTTNSTPVALYSHTPIGSGTFASDGSAYATAGAGNFYGWGISRGINSHVNVGNQSGSGATQFGYSVDGQAWSVGSLPTTWAYANGVGSAVIGGVPTFAVCNQPTIYTRPDTGLASSWTARSGTFNTYIAFSKWTGSTPPTRFVGVQGSTSYVSTDGVTFTAYAGSIPSTSKPPLFVEGTFYLAAGGGIWSSTDGITWGVLASLPASNFNSGYSLIYNGSVYLVIGSQAIYARSTNLTTWTQHTFADGATDNRAVAGGNGVFMRTGYSQTITTSTDGLTWTSRANTGSYRDADYTGSVFIISQDNTGATKYSTITSIV